MTCTTQDVPGIDINAADERMTTPLHWVRYCIFPIPVCTRAPCVNKAKGTNEEADRFKLHLWWPNPVLSYTPRAVYVHVF